MSEQTGSLAWGRRTSGRLGRREQVRFLAQAMRRQLKESWRQLSDVRQRELARLDFSSLRFPDSAIARQSEEHCRELSAEFLVNHCYRTYLWGVVLAKVDRKDFDEEILFVAAQLHDLGLTPAHMHAPDCSCFAIRGAEAAMSFLQNAHYPEPRKHRVGEAIALHMNVALVPPGAGVEAQLLQAGAALDVVGTRFRAVNRDTVKAVLARYPRLDFKQQFADLTQEEAERQPGTRLGLLHRPLMFRQMIRLAPFRE